MNLKLSSYQKDINRTLTNMTYNNVMTHNYHSFGSTPIQSVDLKTIFPSSVMSCLFTYRCKKVSSSRASITATVCCHVIQPLKFFTARFVLACCSFFGHHTSDVYVTMNLTITLISLIIEKSTTFIIMY